MRNPVPMIGVDPAELPWLRAVVQLLRHPDPAVGELTRQALLYLQSTASQRTPPPRAQQLDPTG
jgi:hypothetical protein